MSLDCTLGKAQSVVLLRGMDNEWQAGETKEHVHLDMAEGVRPVAGSIDQCDHGVQIPPWHGFLLFFPSSTPAGLGRRSWRVTLG